MKTYKDSYKLPIMSNVPCSDEFFTKRLISKKKKKKKRKKKKKKKKEERKKERSYSFYLSGLLIEVFYFIFHNS